MTNKMWHRHRNRFTWSFIKNKRRWLGSWYLKRQGDKLRLRSAFLCTPPASPSSLPVPARLLFEFDVAILLGFFVRHTQPNPTERMSTLDWRLCADYRNHVGHFIVWKGVGGGSKSVPCAYLMYLLCKWMYDARKRLIYLFTFRCSTTWGWQYQNIYTALTAHFWFCKISKEGPFVTQASIYTTHID